MNRRINVRAIIIDENGKLFAVHQRHSVNKKELPFWNTPGGGIDSGEDLTSAFKREIIEELGVEPKVGRLLFVKQFMESEKDREYIEFFFEVLNPRDFENIDLSKTTHGKLELLEFGFVDAGKTHLLPAFLKDIDYKNLPSSTQIISYDDIGNVFKY